MECSGLRVEGREGERERPRIRRDKHWNEEEREISDVPFGLQILRQKASKISNDPILLVVVRTRHVWKLGRAHGRKAEGAELSSKLWAQRGLGTRDEGLE